MTLKQKTYTLAELAHLVGGEVRGDATVNIVGITTLQEARPGYISFLANPIYRKYLADTQASAIILSAADLAVCENNALVVADPHAAYAHITHYFATVKDIVPGIHPSAVIGSHTNIHPSSTIEAHVVIGDGVTIGANTVIGAGSSVGDYCSIGADTVLYPHVTLYAKIVMGDRVIVQSGAVIGSDGFGFAFDKKQHAWVKIHHAGTVRIEDDVEIGANTTIDRGTLDDTVIERQVKIDNQVQIAHNARIGAYTVIAGCVGIAGSARIGKYCIIGGSACVAGHIEVADHMKISGMSMVTHSLTQPGGAYSSGTGIMENSQWRKSVIRFRHLDELAKRVQRLEKNAGIDNKT